MATVDEVLVKLEGDTSDLRRDLTRLEQRFSTTTKKLKGDMAGLSGAANGLRTALVALGTGAAIKNIVDLTVQVASLRTSLRAATGSTELAAQAMAFVRSESKRLGVDTLVAAKSFTLLSAAAKGTALEGKETQEIFSSVAEAARVMGLTSDQTKGALLALTQIMSKGTVQAEELRGQLGERIPGAFQIAARAMNVTTQELGDMLQAGEVLAEDFLPKFAKELRATVAEGLPEAVDSAGAAFTRLGNAMTELGIKIGESGIVDGLAAIAEKATEGISIFTKFGRALGETIGRLVQGPLDEGFDGFEDFNLKVTETATTLNQKTTPAVVKTKEELKAAAKEAAAFAKLLDDQFERELEAAIEAEEELESIERDRIQTLMQEAEAVKNLVNPTRELQAELARLEELQGAGLISEDEFIEASFRVQERMEELVKTTDKTTEEMSQFWIQGARNMQSSLSDFLFDPFEGGLDGLASSFERTIRKMAADLVASKLLESVGALFGGTGGAAAGGGFGGVIAGFFQGGGRPPIGRPSIVGEAGPEIFTPDTAGTITPMGQGAAGITIQNNINIQAPEGRISQPSLEQLQTKIGTATSSALRRNR